MEKSFERVVRNGAELVRPTYVEPQEDPLDIEAGTLLAMFEGASLSMGGSELGTAGIKLGPYTLEGEELEAKKKALAERWANYGPPFGVEDYGSEKVLRALVEALRRVFYFLRRGEVELELLEGWSEGHPIEEVDKALEKIVLAPASFMWNVLGALVPEQGTPSGRVVRLPEHLSRMQALTRANPMGVDLFTPPTVRELEIREEGRARLLARGITEASSVSLTWNPTAEEEIVHRALLELFAQRGYPSAVTITSSELLELCGKENNENTLRALKEALGHLSTRSVLFAFQYRPQRGTEARKEAPWRKKETLGPLWSVTRTSAHSTDRTLAWTISPGLPSLKADIGEEPLSIFFQVNRDNLGDPAFYRSEPAGLLQRAKHESTLVQADAIRWRGILGTHCIRHKYESRQMVDAAFSLKDLQRDLHRTDPEGRPKFEGLTTEEALRVRYFTEQRDAGKRPAEIAKELEMELPKLRRLLRRTGTSPKRKAPPSLRTVRTRTAQALEVLRAQGEPYRVSGYTFTGSSVRVVVEVQ
jgi:hypothetical protein